MITESEPWRLLNEALLVLLVCLQVPVRLLAGVCRLGRAVQTIRRAALLLLRRLGRRSLVLLQLLVRLVARPRRALVERRGGWLVLRVELRTGLCER